MKLKSTKNLIGIIKRLKSKGRKIVFTNGCFDILHCGHVEYLVKAKKLGDVLIVGLNSDLSISKIKGPKRPINNQKDRAIVLAALEAVDYVVMFSEDTPYELIKAIKPDVLAKGGDWKPKDIVGSDIVKKTVSVPFVRGYSTTGLLCKIGCKGR
ncbi:MAG: D-glycero-beta-D-manno-heptose 1-phosphate adenylyltransferase [Candidatus Omnitrophica bacterium CG_4_8_14_3_um_filter_43_15]|nr:MAG: D-glycero-beta-D-manno-heptose 1-phosphate adenylyltransferase [Candidatus Omnitrophica bacterium CG_4_8_14_3_um_filter_43_15]